MMWMDPVVPTQQVPVLDWVFEEPDDVVMRAESIDGWEQRVVDDREQRKDPPDHAPCAWFVFPDLWPTIERVRDSGWYSRASRRF